MIARLRGTLDFLGPHFFILDVQGVGYQLFASAHTLRQLPGVGGSVKVFVYTHLRQESLELFGFLEEEAQELFTLLLTVPGVGTRVALAIQSALSPDELIMAIEVQDKAMLTRADGVGPKLAARLVMELKGKTQRVLPSHAFIKSDTTSVPEDTVAVLLRLGYRRPEALQAVQAAMREGLTAVEDIVKAALSRLAQA